MLAQIQDTGVSFPACVIMALLLIATVMFVARIIGHSIRRVTSVIRRVTSFHQAGKARRRRGPLTDPEHRQNSSHAPRSHAIMAAAWFLIICGGLTAASMLSSSAEHVNTPLPSAGNPLAAHQPESGAAEIAVSAAPAEADPAGIPAPVTSIRIPAESGESADRVAESAEMHPQGDILLLPVSPELLTAMLGEAGATSLAQLQSRVGRGVSQAYALIPLTAPGNPVTSGGPSLMAADQLRGLPRLLGLLLRSAADPQKSSSTSELPRHTATESAELPEAGNARLPSAVIPVEAVTPLPAWVKQPNGSRIVVEAYAPFEEDSDESLHAVVSEALTRHLSEQLQDRIRPESHWGRLVRLQLSPATFQKCVVEQHQLVTDIPMPGGPQKWRKTYALVQFSEAVDRAAVQEIRQAVQQHRMAAVLLVTGIFWMAVFSAGLLLRAGRCRTGLLRLSATAGVVLVSLPLGLFAVALTLAVCGGEAIDLPWEFGGRAVTIDASH